MLGSTQLLEIYAGGLTSWGDNWETIILNVSLDLLLMVWDLEVSSIAFGVWVISRCPNNVFSFLYKLLVI